LEYFEPQTPDEAVGLLANYGKRAVVIAGGTDVLLDLKFGKSPECLVNIKRIPGLDAIDETDGGALFGPLVTIRQLQESALVRDRLPLLWQAANQFASLQIRTTATLGGNLCRASPSGEMLAPLRVLEAEVAYTTADGPGRASIADFILGPGRTCLESAGLVTAIQVPWPAAGSAARYLKHAVRGPMDIAIVGVAVQLTADSASECIEAVRIGLAAVGPTPLRAEQTEALLRGKVPDAALLDEAGHSAAAESSPISDQRGSAEHRRWIVEALVRRGIQQCWQELTGNEVTR